MVLTCQARVFCNVRNASVSGGMIVSFKVHGLAAVNPRWHRGLCIDTYSSLIECNVLSGTFLFGFL